MTQFAYISIGSSRYRIEVMRYKDEIERGMRKYSSAPSYGMLFPLEGKYTSVTMKGVSFPLDISFYTKDWKQIPILSEDTIGVRYWMRMYPSDNDRPIPKGSFYMLEFPVGIIPLSSIHLA